MRKVLVLFAVAALLAGCGSLGEKTTGELTVTIGDRIAYQSSVLPGVSLHAETYHLEGLGTSGGATGRTFEADLVPGQTWNSQLAPGAWNITATVYNDDLPPVALGEGSAVATVIVGSPATAHIVLTEYVGNGTLAGQFAWWPDVISDPEPVATMLKYGGSPVNFPLTLTDGTHASGSSQFANGWYTGFFTLSDNGVLACGIVRAVRILKDATTTWSENIEVSLLDGSLTIDLEYYEGLPLTLVTTPGAGEVPLYDGEPVTITVTSAGQDAGHGCLYSWYMDGVATSLSTDPFYVADPADFAPGTIHYLSVIVFQDDGKRAGDASFLLRMAGQNPALLAVSGTVDNTPFSLGVPFTIELIDAASHAVIDSVAAPYAGEGEGLRPFNLGAQVAGEYHLRVVIAAGGDFPAGKTSYWITNGSSTTNIASAGVLTIPHLLGATFTFPEVAVTP